MNVSQMTRALQDALDALTFDPPHLEAVEQRIKMVLRVLRALEEVA